MNLNTMYRNSVRKERDALLTENEVLREQVKVLRKALGWLNNEMACRDDDFGGCLFSRQDFEIVRKALEQTKPKEGE